MAHTALRDLVERAVDEARKLPGLGATVSTGIQEDSSFPDQNYEELLATAILNKVSRENRFYWVYNYVPKSILINWDRIEFASAGDREISKRTRRR